MTTNSENTEKRLWNIVIAACFALGGWWLQNQYDTLLELNRSFIAYQQYVDQNYVEKEFLAQVTNERERRLNAIERKLDKIIEQQIQQFGPFRGSGPRPPRGGGR